METFLYICFSIILMLDCNVVVAAVADPALPQPPVLRSPPPELPVGPSSIFAVPGAHCPPGSDPYKGPEAQAAAKAGMLYCEMKRKVMVVSKKSGVTACQLPFVPYTSEAGITPDADVIWCRMMQPGETPPPMPVPPLTAPLPSRDAPTLPKQLPNK